MVTDNPLVKQYEAEMADFISAKAATQAAGLKYTSTVKDSTIPLAEILAAVFKTSALNGHLVTLRKSVYNLLIKRLSTLTEPHRVALTNLYKQLRETNANPRGLSLADRNSGENGYVVFIFSLVIFIAMIIAILYAARARLLGSPVTPPRMS